MAAPPLAEEVGHVPSDTISMVEFPRWPIKEQHTQITWGQAPASFAAMEWNSRPPARETNGCEWTGHAVEGGGAGVDIRSWKREWSIFVHAGFSIQALCLWLRSSLAFAERSNPRLEARRKWLCSKASGKARPRAGAANYKAACWNFITLMSNSLCFLSPAFILISMYCMSLLLLILFAYFHSSICGFSVVWMRITTTFAIFNHVVTKTLNWALIGREILTKSKLLWKFSLWKRISGII